MRVYLQTRLMPNISTFGVFLSPTYPFFYLYLPPPQGFVPHPFGAFPVPGSTVFDLVGYIGPLYAHPPHMLPLKLHSISHNEAMPRFSQALAYHRQQDLVQSIYLGPAVRCNPVRVSRVQGSFLFSSKFGTWDVLAQSVSKGIGDADN